MLREWKERLAARVQELEQMTTAADTKIAGLEQSLIEVRAEFTLRDATRVIMSSTLKVSVGPQTRVRPYANSYAYAYAYAYACA